MTKPELVAALKTLIVEECDAEIEPGDIEDDRELIGGGLDLDSLDALQIAMAVKDNYGVRIEGGPDGRKAFASVSALADFILEGQAAAG